MPKRKSSWKPSSVRAAEKNRYECALCHRRLPSPEAAEAHLQKRHEGHGYVTYCAALQRAKEKERGKG